MGRVLFVDDDESTRIIVGTRLKRAGHRVVDAASAEEALETMQSREAPDVAVLDVQLPGMDGVALAEELRTQTGDPELPVIFLSGRVREPDIERGREIGAVYLTKPFVGPALLNAVDKALPDDDTW